MKAVVIVSEINKSAVFRLVGLALLAATAGGLGLGISTASVQDGLGFFTGISTALSLLIAILHWASK
jgi:hypothetical protein